MRRSLLYFIAFIGALLAASCGTAATPTPAGTVAAPWGAGDRAEYALQAGGQDIGTMIFTVMSNNDGYVIASEATVGAVKQTTRVQVGGGLNPIAATQQLTGTGKTDYALMKVYDKGKLSLQARTAEGDKAVTVDCPAGSWDNDQLLQSVRTLSLTDGYSRTLTMFAGTTTPLKVTINVVGNEDVRVPAGSYTAHKVALNFGASTHYAWYDSNKPYILVKYENADNKQTLALTKVGLP